MNIPEATRAEFRQYPVEKKWQMVLLAQKNTDTKEVIVPLVFAAMLILFSRI